ncbi:peroxiredoxin [Pseudosulfitobacter pseudonitzschiae]|uniref:thioredoxin-dependent peroxiredoxin n=1 Tax=Pseudosulfitobacter pseudonitzschiae TaxID=1402135 RepID=A0A073IYS4_9RHOB|nr:peroxiredoxin [Pseudosulfitobacter pseudonitzschiae]KEJ94596.1 alkyl hydroperoxide reductase [Pseudosulfitobacter pseudonitzschiae]MBM1813469.1 peroxiredoxin [Pseudosulfitobacter pseudonitzschiae]MBM1830462.1 peroxiredoxin [Pseudosulfitobacter pseudonitzschiae]MBM1835329.1 peroxiredoxin [Pseudosulfitobacter pseudonitzschiae]MBM1840175.1 peroxiredoxin [Pseudosulfitobacter pseudonitzschiae]
MIEVASTAPDFTLPQTEGPEVTLSNLRGTPVVLFFYPKDNTPGCTKESIAFSEHMQAFADAGAQVYGISKDSLKKHANFTAKHDLTVPLLSDENGTVCEDYGVWKEKQMYGKTFLGIERTTVLIAADGTIARIWPRVKVPGHAEEVLEAVKAL